MIRMRFNHYVYPALIVIMTIVMVQVTHAGTPPWVFTENQGQWEDPVLYRAHMPGGFTFITKDKVRMAFFHPDDMKKLHDDRTVDHTVRGQSISYEFGKERGELPFTGRFPLQTKFSYFIGDDPERWASGLQGFTEIRRQEVYPGIDLEMYSQNQNLKYDFIVKPGADPAEIQYTINGADTVYTDGTYLYVRAGFVEFREGPLMVFQEGDDGEKEMIEATYQLNNGQIGFSTGQYDLNRRLFIDPELIFSTFSGSPADNFGYTATYDSEGNGYAGGTVFDHGFPVTDGAFQSEFTGGNNPQPGTGDVARNVGILKFNSQGTDLLYATYLGGGNGNEDPHSMIVNSMDELIVFGNTTSADFPVTSNAWGQDLTGESSIYISRFSVDGTQLIASTSIGGSGWDGRNGRVQNDRINSSPVGYNFGDMYRGEVLTDENDNIYVATSTQSPDFPVTPGVFGETWGGGDQDACIIRFSPGLDSLHWASFLGGSNDDAAFGILLHPGGNLYVSGGTASTDFPVSSEAMLGTYPGGNASGYVVAVSIDGSTIEHGTYLGNSDYNLGFFVQSGPENNIYVAGQTEGTNYPITPGIHADPGSGQFIEKLTPDLSNRIWSTVFGSGRGLPDISPSAFLVDDCGRIYYSGWGGETNWVPPDWGEYDLTMEITGDAIQSVNNGSGFYIAVFEPGMQDIVFGSYMGSMSATDHVDGGTSRFDERGNIYQSVCAGCGGYSDFPTTSDAWSVVNPSTRPNNPGQGGCNNALFRIQFTFDVDFTTVADTCEKLVSFHSSAEYAFAHHWDFGDGNTSEEANPVHQFEDYASYDVTMIANPNTPCADTSTQTIDLTITRPDDLEVPNAFSPDGDDINDVFFIRNVDKLACDDYEFLLYNRWGNKVLHKTDHYFEWDGTQNGKPLEAGTYFYIIRWDGGDESGVINLFR